MYMCLLMLMNTTTFNQNCIHMCKLDCFGLEIRCTVSNFSPDLVRISASKAPVSTGICITMSTPADVSLFPQFHD